MLVCLWLAHVLCTCYVGYIRRLFVGTRFLCSVLVAPVRNESSEIMLFIVNLEDITDAPLKHDSYRGSLRHSPYISAVCLFIKPPPPVGAGGGYMFSARPSVPLSVRACVRLCVHPSVRDSRGSFMFPRYLQYLLTDFRQTFVTGASWDTDDLITFLGQNQSSRSHHRGGGAQHSTLPSSATFSSFFIITVYIVFVIVHSHCWLGAYPEALDGQLPEI